MNYNTKYVVRLTGEEREELAAVVGRGKGAGGKRRRAQVLLKADAGVTGSGRTDQEICEALDVSVGLVQEVRQGYVEHGLNAALEWKPKSRHRPRKLGGEREARLIAVACGPAPEGRARWTLRLLADKLVELEIVDSIGQDAVRRRLKKTN